MAGEPLSLPEYLSIRRTCISRIRRFANYQYYDLFTEFFLPLHNETNPVPPLIKIGIAHYQFETIHPFPDDNGRIGRLLIALFLVSNGLLHKPTLYLSDFFERNRMPYYDNLRRVSSHNDLTQRLKFFLVGVKETSVNSIQTFKNIIALRSEVEQKVVTLDKKYDLAKSFLEYLYKEPKTDAQTASEALNINITTALRLIDDFENLCSFNSKYFRGFWHKLKYSLFLHIQHN